MYFVLFSAFFLLAVLHAFLLRKDQQQLNAGNTAAPTLPQAFPMLLGTLGFFLFLAPWIDLPIAGGVSFVRLFGSGVELPGLTTSGDLYLYGALLFCTFLLMISGNLFQLGFKVKVKSTATLGFELLLGIVSAVTGLLNLRFFMAQAWTAQGQTALSDLFGMEAGFGIYLLPMIGIGYCAVVAVKLKRRR